MDGHYIFDIHDIPLIATAGLCLLLGGILFLSAGQGRAGNGILGMLLLFFGIRAIDDLLYWNPFINPIITEEIGIWPFWVLEWAPICLGPLMYAYIRLRLVGQPIVWRQDAKHVIPIIAAILAIIIACIQMDENEWQAGVSNWGYWYNNLYYQAFLIGEKLSIIIYSIQTLRFMKRHKDKLTGSFSNLERTEPTWLYAIAIGFLCLGLWFGCFVIADYSGLGYLTAPMGKLSNYFMFVFITVLVAFSLNTSYLTTSLEKNRDGLLSNNEENDTQTGVVQELYKCLVNDKLYLNPELTLNQLASAANMSNRQVSEVLNIQVGKNFFDFVNTARVDKAKELLISTNVPVVEVFQDSGFNSKPSFNRIFKRYVNQTPTEFRKSSKSSRPELRHMP